MAHTSIDGDNGSRPVRNGVGRDLGALIAGYVATNVLLLTGVFLLFSRDGLEKDMGVTWLVWIVTLAEIAGGYTAATVARAREIMIGLVLGVAFQISFMYMSAETTKVLFDADPLSTVGRVALAVGAPVFGAYLRKRRRMRSEEREADRHVAEKVEERETIL